MTPPSQPLPEWPAPLDQQRMHDLWQDDLEQYNDVMWGHEHAKYEAAMARLRVAVEAGQRAYNLVSNARFEEYPGPLMWAALDEWKAALALIGPLPPLADEVWG